MSHKHDYVICVNAKNNSFRCECGKDKPMSKAKRTDRQRLNWLAKHQWDKEECLLDDCYIYGNKGDSLRKAIDSAMDSEKGKKA